MAPPFEIVRPLPDWWPHLFFHRCKPKLLVVTDSLTFDSSGFGLQIFLNEIAKYSPAPAITTMVHGVGALFDASVTTANYDQIWLFGARGPALNDNEVQILLRFMDGGGGVFATGDHESLGFTLCGELPRVRKMRNWQSVPVSVNRIDTVTNPGPDRRTQFDDQSDEIPQRIFPTYYGSGSSAAPHPLLRSPLGDIDVLPDHPHESRCLTGSDPDYGYFAGASLADPYQLHGLDVPEFPFLGGAPLAPEIVAWSVSAGRYLNPPGSVEDKPFTTPKLFGAISAWDGHRVARGRIVCDATWHHFININLDGTGAVPATGNNRNGLRDGAGNFTADFHQIAQYYRNIVDWLIPANRRWCRWYIYLVLERYHYPLFEEFEPLPDLNPCPWEPRLRLGTQVDAALTAVHGNGIADDIAIAALELAGLERLAEELRPKAELNGDRQPTLLDLALFRRGILGSVADALLRDLPSNPRDLAAHLEKHAHDDDRLQAAVVEATRDAVAAASDYYKRAAERTFTLLG